MSLRTIIWLTKVLLSAVIAFAVLGCSTIRSTDHSLPAEQLSDKNDVVLLPTEDFPFNFAANLAKILTKDTKLRIRAVLNLGTKDWHPYYNVPQYDPSTLKDIASPAIAELKKTYGGSLYIILTTRDINNSDGNLHFIFAQSYPENNVSVISAARMLIGDGGQQASEEIVAERLRKMSLRTIGLQYYGLPRTADPHDILYSPLMSLDALDAIEPTLRHQ